MAVGQFKVGEVVVDILARTQSLEKGMADARRHVEGFGTSMTRAIRISAGIAGVASGILAVRTAIQGTIGASLSFESSFAGVRKTVDATEAQFAALETTFRNMAKELPTSVNEINAVAEAAGQLGIKVDDLEKFTRVMVDLGNTTNMTAQEAAVALARLANIMGTSVQDFERLGSAVVALGNKFPAFEGEIVEMSLRLAGAGEQIGLTEAQVVGLATAMLSVGVKVEAGGSAMSRVLIEMANSAAKGGEKLETMAEVAGMTSEAFTELIQTNPAEALVALVQGLQNVSDAGGNVFKVLEDLGFNTIRIRDVLLRLAGAGDLVAETMSAGTVAWQENNALVEEANKRYETAQSQLLMFKNRILDVGISIGDAMIPSILGVVGGLVELIEIFTEVGFAADALQGILITVVTTFAAFKIIDLVTMLGRLAVSVAQVEVAFVSWNSALIASGSAVAAFNPVLLGLVAAFGALEIGLQVFTGQGLMGRITETLFSLGEGVDAAAEAIERLNEVSSNSVIPLERSLVAQHQFNQILSEYSSLQGQLNEIKSKYVGITGEQVAKETELQLLSEQILALLPELGLNYEELTTLIGGLDPELQKVIFSSEFWKTTLEAQTIAATEAYNAAEDLGEAYGEIPEPVDEAEQALKELAESLGITEEELEDAKKAAETFSETFRESLVDGFADILPDFSSSIDEWIEELDRLVDAYENMDGNLEAIYQALQAANVQNADAIIEALRSKGPVYVAEFITYFAQKPEEALALFAELAPHLTDQAANNAAAAVADNPQAMADAVTLGLINPAIAALNSMASIFGASGYEAGAAWRAGLAGGMSSGGSVPRGRGPKTAAHAAPPVPDFQDAIDNLISQAGVGGQAFAQGGGGGGGGGGGSSSSKSIEEEAEEAAKTIAEIFTETFAEEARSAKWEAEFTSAGADLANALIEAVIEGTDAGAERLARETQDFIDALAEEGITAGDEFIAGIVNALEAGTSESIDAAIALIKELGIELKEAAEDEGEEAAKSLIDTFTETVSEETARNHAVEQMGNSGVRLIEYLEEGLEEEKPEAIEKAAGVAVDIIAEIEEKFGSANTQGFINEFMNTLASYIETGGAGLLDKLRALLRQINVALGEEGTIGDLGGGAAPSTGSGIQVMGAVTIAGRQHLVGISPSGQAVIQQGDGTWKVTNQFASFNEDGSIADPFGGTQVRPIAFNNPGGGGITGNSSWQWDPDRGVWVAPDGSTMSDPVSDFHTGVSMVPREMFARLHPGEAVLTREQNMRRMSRGGNEGAVIDVHLYGDLANLVERIETTKRRRLL